MEDGAVVVALVGETNEVLDRLLRRNHRQERSASRVFEPEGVGRLSDAVEESRRRERAREGRESVPWERGRRRAQR